jgi:hypothetical protein
MGLWKDRPSFYYFFIVFVVIMYKTKATAGRALAFIVRIFVNDTIAIAVWTSFHAIGVWRGLHDRTLACIGASGQIWPSPSPW